MTHPTCRACGTELTDTLVDLGDTPLANSYLPVNDRAAVQAEKAWPLHARVCPNCLLVQVDDAVPASEIFSHYAYFSSYSASWVAHAKRYTEAATARLGLNRDSLVVEVASNDGYLLQHFVANDIPVLGVEPAANIAAEAEKIGVRSKVAFFGRDTAADVVRDYGKADLTAANNVLAHVPDINDFVAGFAIVLKDEGVSTFEFPHLLNLINLNQFDTIYHEHYSYLSLLSVEKIFADNGMRVFDVEELDTHGGSLRIWACKQHAGHQETEGLLAVRAKEAAAQFDVMDGYKGFTVKCETVRDDLVQFLKDCQAGGKKVVAYGAAAKGNTLLNYARVGADLIDYCVDANPHKQNTLLPGSHVPVFDPGKIAETRPDYVLILPWNLKTEISESMSHVRDWGGKFVIAVPGLEIF